MLFKTTIIFGLSASALGRAHPKRRSAYHHGHHHTAASTGGLSMPTGGPYSCPDNETEFETSATGTGFATPIGASVPSSVSISPMLASSIYAAVGAASISCNAFSTTTVTLTDLVTVTVSSSDDSESVAPTPANFSLSPVVLVTADSSTASSTSTSFAARVSSSSSASVLGGEFYASSLSGAAAYGGRTSSVTASAAPASSAYSDIVSFGTSISSSVAASVTTSAAFRASGVASSTTSSAAASTSSVSVSTGGAGKRGISYNDAALTNAFSGSPISWAYNWASSAGGSIAPGMSYVPMLWGTDSDHTGNWASAAQSAIDSGAQALLSFNEPDRKDQSNIDPSTAAAAHIKYMNPFAGKAEIVSPAITNGDADNPPTGLPWLRQFFHACGRNCTVHAVAFHWYDSASNFAYFKKHVQDVIDTAAKNGVSKVWLTEFQAFGSDTEIASFMVKALQLLDSTSAVERYAWFRCASGSGNLLSGSSLSAVGDTYAS